MKTFIAFRLRKELDADLIALGIDEDKLPDLCRNGLRLMLGIKTAKQVELTERPIVPQQHQVTEHLPAKTATYKPKSGGVWIANQNS